jgi:hypothetical protein
LDQVEEGRGTRPDHLVLEQPFQSRLPERSGFRDLWRLFDEKVEERLALDGVTADEAQVEAQPLHLILTGLLIVEEVVPGEGEQPQLRGDILDDGPGCLADLFEEMPSPAQNAQLDRVTQPQRRTATAANFLKVFSAEQKAFLEEVGVQWIRQLILFVDETHGGVPRAR